MNKIRIAVFVLAMLVGATVSAADYVVINFSATWCGPCQYMKANVWPAKSVQDAIKKRPLDFYSVDIDRYPGLANAYGVSVVPTTIIAKRTTDGKAKEIDRFVGSGSPASLVQFLERTK